MLLLLNAILKEKFYDQISALRPNLFIESTMKRIKLEGRRKYVEKKKIAQYKNNRMWVTTVL